MQSCCVQKEETKTGNLLRQTVILLSEKLT